MAKQLDIELLLKVSGLKDVASLEKAIGEIIKEFQKLEGNRALDAIFGQSAKAERAFAKLQIEAQRMNEQFDKLKAASLAKLNKEVADIFTVMAKSREEAEKFRLKTVEAANKAAEAFGKAQAKAIQMNEAFDRLKAKKLLDVAAAAQEVQDKFNKAWTEAIKMDAAFEKAQRSAALLAIKAREMNAALDQAKSDKIKEAAEAADKAAQKLGKLQAEAQLMNAAFDRIKAEKLRQVQAAAQEASTVIGRLGLAFKAMGQQQEQAAKAATTHASAVGGLTRDILFFRRAIIGLGIAALSTGVLDVAKAFDRARQSISAVFGEANAAAEFEFIRIQAERLGVSVTELATQYAKFSSAAKSLGLSQEIIRDNFLAVAEAGGKLSLASTEIEGALTAIQQIASKGRLSMEELRQQLGDRLPGAISIAAKGLGLTEARLFALVEQGKITSQMFLNTFPAALRASFGTDSNTRIETTTAILQRFKNGLAELTDTALRAGVLDAFTDTVKALTNAFRDPRVVEGLKDMSKALGNLINLARENIGVLSKLLAGFLALRVVGTLISVFTAFGATITKVAAGITAYNAAAALAAGNTAAMAGNAAKALPILGSIATVLGTIAKIAFNPITLTIGGLVAFKVAVDGIAESMGRALDASLALADANRTAESQKRVVATLQAHADALSVYANTAIKTAEQIKKLSAEQLRSYAESVEGAKLFQEQNAKVIQAHIKGIEAQIQALKLSGSTSNETVIKLFRLNTELGDLKESLAKATASAVTFKDTLTNVEKAATANDVALDPYIQRLRDLTADFGKANKASKGFVEVFDFDQLDRETQGLVASFRKTIDEGKGVKKAFEDMLPKDFAQGGIKELTQVGNTLALLEKEGSIAAHVIGDQLAKALDKLDADDLQKVGINAQAAFEMGTLAAKGLAFVVDGQLRAALKNLGVDAENVEKDISKSFMEISKNFRLVAENGKASGDQLRAALDVAIDGAKTQKELLLIKDTVDQLGLASGTMGKAIEDSLLRLGDKIRLTAGVLNSALGDSMKRLGVVGKEQLKALADQAVIDFNRIKASGVAASLEIEAAWRMMAEAVIKANNGIPPISIVLKAVDFNAFDIIVKAAEKASERVKKAIEDAIPLADTTEKLRALADAITLSFQKGKLAVDDFGKFITEVGFKLRDSIAKPIGEIAAAADLLGVKTKDQLTATADNAREAFQIITQSGQFSSAQLTIAAQQYLDAYLAANNGVLDSFDPVVQKALDLVNGVQTATKALDDLKVKSDEMKGIDTGDLRNKSSSDLQTLLLDTIKAYRAIGVTNVEQLQIVKDIQAEMNRKGLETSEAMRKKQEEATALAAEHNKILKDGGGSTGGGSGGGTPKGGGGVIPGLGATVNTTINIGGGAVTADEVRRTVVPVLTQISKRILK